MNEGKIIVLNPDDKERTLDNLKNAYFAIKNLFDYVKNDKLTENMRDTIPQLVEYQMADISKVIGFDSISEKKVEEKHAEIRQANQKIRELEQKLGSSHSIDGLKEQLKMISNLFKKWWHIEGFSHVEHLNFTEHGYLEAKLSISFYRSSIFSKKPVSGRLKEAEWLENLKEQGYQIHEEHDKFLIACQQNEELLTQLLMERFPSLEIESWEKRRSPFTSERIYEIKTIKIEITDMTDLKEFIKYMEKYSNEDE